MHELVDASPVAAPMRLTVACALHGRSFVRWAIADGRWQRPHPHVVVPHNGPLSREERAVVAWLASPSGAVLGFHTAAELGGLRGFESDLVHVVLPQGGRAVAIPGVRTHWSTALSSRDVLAAPPGRTRLARSVLDVASAMSAERMARAVVLASVQQRLARCRDLVDSLSRRGPCRHRALILESICDARGGIDSVPEADFDRIVRERRLPPPTRQAVVAGADGRYHLDAAWEALRVGAEVHGSHHREGRQWEHDLMRHNDVTATGRRLLHFSSFSVRHEARRVGDLLEGTLVSAGLRH